MSEGNTDTITRAEFEKLEKLAQNLQKALEDERKARTKAEEDAAGKRADQAEDKLEAAAREAGVSVAALKAAAESERQAEFDRRMDTWAESRGVEVNDGGGNEPDDDTADDDTADDTDDDTADEGGKPKTLKTPKKKPAAKPETDDGNEPDNVHFSERPLFRRRGKE